jgi:hypothetical protein
MSASGVHPRYLSTVDNERAKRADGTETVVTRSAAWICQPRVGVLQLARLPTAARR